MGFGVVSPWAVGVGVGGVGLWAFPLPGWCVGMLLFPCLVSVAPLALPWYVWGLGTLQRSNGGCYTVVKRGQSVRGMYSGFVPWRVAL